MDQDAPDAVVEEQDNVEDAEPQSLPQQGPAASPAADSPQDCGPNSTNLDIKGVTDGTAGTANTSSSVDGGMGNKHFGPVQGDQIVVENLTIHPSCKSETTSGHGEKSSLTVEKGNLNIQPISNNSATSTDVIDNPPVTDEPEDWFERVPASRKDGQVKEKDLIQLVKGLGNGWEFIAVELNLKQVTIEQLKMSKDHPPIQMLNAFVKWRQKETHKATFGAFVKAIKACEDVCTIDWDVIKKVVENG